MLSFGAVMAPVISVTEPHRSTPEAINHEFILASYRLNASGLMNFFTEINFLPVLLAQIVPNEARDECAN